MQFSTRKEANEKYFIHFTQVEWVYSQLKNQMFKLHGSGMMTSGWPAVVRWGIKPKTASWKAARSQFTMDLTRQVNGCLSQ